VYLDTESPDIIGLCEIFPKNAMDKESISDLVLPSYMYERLVPDRQGDFGIVLFVKNYINVSKISIFSENFNESVWCEIIVSQNEKLLVGLIYRSPSSSQQNNDMLLSTINRAIELGYSNYLFFWRL
jgi:hypothetical protein